MSIANSFFITSAYTERDETIHSSNLCKTLNNPFFLGKKIMDLLTLVPPRADCVQRLEYLKHS